MKGQCHCRECQYIAGGAPVLILGMPADGFEFTRGKPSEFTRSDIDNPVTREFCPSCGTHLTTRIPGYPTIMIKVGTLDDPAVWGGPDVAIYTCDMQPFHQLPEGVPHFDRLPG